MAKSRKAKNKKAGGATTNTHGVTPKTAPKTSKPKAEPTRRPAMTEALRCLITDGDARVATRDHKGKEIRFEIKGGLYERPRGMDDAEWRTRVRHLLASGEWVDISSVASISTMTDGDPTVYVYKFAHPDNVPGDPKQGEITVMVDGQVVPLELAPDGTVSSEDAAVARALEEKGFVPAGRLLKE